MLFTGAKVSQLALLPQGQPERARRALALVRAMDHLGFGNCGNERECEAACPKSISIRNIARLNRGPRCSRRKNNWLIQGGIA